LMLDSLIINVEIIPEEGLNYIVSEDGMRFNEFLTDTVDNDFTLRKVDLDCRITKMSTTVFIKGELSAVIDSNCSRCLEDISVPIGGNFAYTLIPAKAETREDVELTAEELEISHYSGEFIDFTSIICEQILLQIPIKKLCREECKGLCAHCGMNLNNSSCNCNLAAVNNKMAVLKNFIVKN
jgi:uncharacterized protein